MLTGALTILVKKKKREMFGSTFLTKEESFCIFCHSKTLLGSVFNQLKTINKCFYFKYGWQIKWNQFLKRICESILVGFLILNKKRHESETVWHFYWIWVTEKWRQPGCSFRSTLFCHRITFYILCNHLIITIMTKMSTFGLNIFWIFWNSKLKNTLFGAKLRNKAQVKNHVQLHLL